MPKGAKPGENRFKSSQLKKIDFRRRRIEEHVLPGLKALIGRVQINGPTPFCKICADLYNRDLPVNENKMGYRTFEQNIEYWKLVGKLFHQHWDNDENLESRKNAISDRLTIKENHDLARNLERLQAENDALKATLRVHGANAAEEIHPQLTSKAESNHSFESVCLALKIIIEASNGLFLIDESSQKITSTFDDLEPEEGLVPKEVAVPFIRWYQQRKEKTGGRS